MKLQFEMEMKDYLDFSYFMLKRNPLIVILMTLLVLALPGPFMVRVIFGPGASPLRSVLSEIVLLMLSFAIVNWLLRRRLIQAINQRPGSLGPCTVDISPEEIVENTSASETRMAWSKVGKIMDSPRHVIMMISPSAAFIIPKRVFQGDEQAQEFLAMVRAYQNGASSPSAPAGEFPPTPLRRRPR